MGKGTRIPAKFLSWVTVWTLVLELYGGYSVWPYQATVACETYENKSIGFAYTQSLKYKFLLYISPLKKKAHFLYFQIFAVSMFYMYNQKNRRAKRLKEGSY